MPSDKYLIIGASPFHNEEGVLSTKNISVEFSKNMDASTLHEGTVYLQEVNGEKVNCVYEYTNLKKILTLRPENPLKNYTQYAIVVVGGESGPQSILGDYPFATRKFEFTTKDEIVFPSLQINASSKNGFLSLSFNTENLFDGEIQYKVSQSNDFEQDGFYPETGVKTTKEKRVDVPVFLEEGIYYIHACLKKEMSFGEYISTQHYIEKKEECVSPSVPLPIFNLFLEKSYPEDGATYGDVDKLGLIFSEKISIQKTVEENLISLRKKKVRFFDEEILLPISIRGLDENNQLAEEAKMIVVIPDELLEYANEYELTLSKNLQSIEDEIRVLGATKTIGFRTKPAFVYVTPDNILGILGEIGLVLGEKEILEAIERVSKEIYERLSKEESSLLEDLDNGDVPYGVYLYVLYKACKILLTRVMIRQGKGRGQTITLSDLTVKKEDWDKSVYDSLLDELEEGLEKAEDELFKKTHAKMGMTTKGESGAAYPDFMSRSEYKELGG